MKALFQITLQLICILHETESFSATAGGTGRRSLVDPDQLRSGIVPHNRQSLVQAKPPTRRATHVLLASPTGITQEQEDDRRGVSASNRGSLFARSSKRITKSIARFWRNALGWMRQLTKWGSGNRLRTMLVAAVLSFSLFFASGERIDNYYNNQQNPVAAANTIPVIERLQPAKTPPNLAATRGGSATSSSSSLLSESVLDEATDPRYHDFSIFKPKEGSVLHKVEHEIVRPIKGSRVEEGMVQARKATSRTFKEAMMDLAKYMRGPKSDALILLLATALITPLCKKFGTNPILGFLGSGMLLGPNGLGVIRGIHTTEVFAELGIVFFLFEMGIELSIERLMQMRKDVFGLGFLQFMLTGALVAAVGGLVGLPANAQVVIGGGLALSSSAFVLQLLKDKNQLATRFGKASFGILLFQDLAVVPLLVVTPILAGSGSLTSAVGSALLKAGLALGSIALAGRFLLNRLFRTVAEANSQEAFLGLVLLTVLSMSFMTEGLGLSNTLGAFLAGVLLSETKYRYQVEADISPFRGILLGLFFVTVGYEIDLRLIAAQLPIVGSLVVGIMALKAAVTTALSLGFGLSLPTSLQTGLILSQGGEFAFVAFGLARSLGILDGPTTKLLLTSASLTMALTPLMSSIGAKVAKKLEESSDFTHYLGQDTDATEIKNSDDGFAVVVGYGAVGKVVCNLLDRKLIKYVGLEIDPNKAIQARNLGLPVFYGDIGRQEVAEAFNVEKAKIVIVCIKERAQATRVVIALRRWYPDLKIFCRAEDADHASRLQNTLNVAAMVPVLPEDTLMMTLPFGAAVMRSLGVPAEEVTAIIENKKREVLMDRNLQDLGEEAMLAQLGISDLGDDGDDPNVHQQLVDKAAAERRQQTLEKSPFVAEVIQDACPDSVCIEEDEDEAQRVVDALVVAEPVPETVPVNQTDSSVVTEPVPQMKTETVPENQTVETEPLVEKPEPTTQLAEPTEPTEAAQVEIPPKTGDVDGFEDSDAFQ